MDKETNLKDIKLVDPSPEALAEGHRNWINWLKTNQNNFSFWYPKLKGVLKTPKSLVIPVPDEMLEKFFCEKKGDFESLESWIAQDVIPQLQKEFPGSDKIFMKNGCFSNKFYFSASCLLESIDSRTITDHLLNIEQAALCFDTCGDLELVFREWIEPVPGTPTIYGGMPLRPEMRVFYDFDRKKILYDKFYWDWDYCFPHIEGTEDEQEYSDTYPVIECEYLSKRSEVLRRLSEDLSNVNGMDGVWSIDVLINGEEMWMIDAAVAQQSAYWDPEIYRLSFGDSKG